MAAPKSRSNATPAAREREGADEPTEVSLDGKTIRIPGTQHWTAEATEDLSNGQVQRWAAATLDDDSWDVWVAVNPTNSDVEAMFEELNEKQGVSVGESRASRRLRQRMARR